jgi:uncharacterized phage protein (TIGR02218 family)
MSYASLEFSLEDGRPIYLYRFSLNDKTWRYTSADEDIEKAGQLWIAVPIADDGIRQTGDAVTDSLNITTTTSIVPVQLYMHYPPSRDVSVAIFTSHEGDDEIRAIYVGDVTQCNVLQPGTAKLTCETFSATMEREGLRLGWQRNCPYALYDPVTCKVDKTAIALTGAVTNVVDNVVTLPAIGGQGLGHYRGGFVEWTDPVRGIERRSIEDHAVDSTLVMFGGAEGIAIGTVLTAYPGCDRTVNACSVIFNNYDNYGGAPSLKGKSPFDGQSVFN